MALGPMQFLVKLAVVLFSVYAWTISFMIMTIVVLLSVATAPFLSFHDSHSWLGGFGMALCLRATFSRVDVIYDDRFDPERRSMFCQNHVNLLDAHAACAAIPHGFSGMMNAWQLNIPIYGWIMRLSEGIPVVEGGPSVFRAVAAQVKDRFERRVSVLVFPEGTRTRDGKVNEFKRGVFVMARDVGVPVVPLAVRGMFHLNRPHSRLIRPSRISIYVGPQIETEGMSSKQIRQLTTRMQESIAQFVETGEIPDATALLELGADR